MEPHGAVSPAAGVSGDVALEGHGAGAGTHKLVKAMSTMLIMSFFTYFLFNARGASEKPRSPFCW